MVNAAFAEANGFVVGDVFHANINGQRRALTITGTALSPEFIYTIGPGALMPDNEGYGISVDDRGRRRRRLRHGGRVQPPRAQDQRRGGARGRDGRARRASRPLRRARRL
jgi:hypothetical protein